MTHNQRQPGRKTLNHLRGWLLTVAAVLLSGAVATADETTYVMVGDQPVQMTIDTDTVAVVGNQATAERFRQTLRARGLSAQEEVSTSRYTLLSSGGLADELRSAFQVPARTGAVTVAPLILANNAHRQVGTGEIVIGFYSDQTVEQLAALAEAYGLTYLREVEVEGSFYIFGIEDPFDVVNVCGLLAEDDAVVCAYPHVFHLDMATQARININDPLFGQQWHLRNTGQTGGAAGEDANMRSIWNVFTGQGVVVAVVDSYLQGTHEDLRGRYLPRYSKDYSTSGELVSSSYHGTAVAGVIGATDGNRRGGIGVAPNAYLAGRRIFEGDAFIVTEEELAETHTHLVHAIDVFNNSWGFTQGVLSPGQTPPLLGAAFLTGVRQGRDGLGSIYVYSAGNSFEIDDNTNFSGLTNSPYTITVAASNHHGNHASYSTPGANLLVTAPSGDTNTAGIMTTDLMNEDGGAAGNYVLTFDGTSAAAPIVSGVVALMLEANPDLTWQEVQQILLTTAYQNASTDSSWERQGELQVPAKFPYSHLHGFGRVDADAAVRTAASFITNGPRISASVTKIEHPPQGAEAWSVSNGTILERTLDFQGETNLFLEDVKVSLSLSTSSWGLFNVTLISPSGTTSVLVPGNNTNGTGSLTNATFRTVRHWGEPLIAGEFADAQSGGGVWTLRIQAPSGGSGQLLFWEMTATGRVDEDFGGFGDGLPDEWEYQFFGSNAVLDTIRPDDDPNADGKTNYEHFLDGTNPMNRTTIVYSLTEQTWLEGAQAREVQVRRGLLVNDRNNDDLFALLRYRDRTNGILYFHEEHWGQVADWSGDEGGAAVLKFFANGERRQEEVIAATDYFDTPVDDNGDAIADVYLSRILIGRNVQNADQFGITRELLARSLRGTVTKRFFSEGDNPELKFGNGRLIARVDNAATVEANRNNRSGLVEAGLARQEYLRKGFVERLLTLDLASDTVAEDQLSGSITATVTRTTSNNNPVLLQEMTVFLTSHNPDEVSVPPTVVIPANRSSATFNVTVTPVDNDNGSAFQGNGLVDREVRFRATAIDRTPDVATITIEEDD